MTLLNSFTGLKVLGSNHDILVGFALKFKETERKGDTYKNNSKLRFSYMQYFSVTATNVSDLLFFFFVLLNCFLADTPQKENHANRNQNGRTHKAQLVKVSSMSPSQREAFKQNLQSAEEVACTLVYDDGWSMLRPKKQVYMLLIDLIGYDIKLHKLQDILYGSTIDPSIIVASCE